VFCASFWTATYASVFDLTLPFFAPSHSVDVALVRSCWPMPRDPFFGGAAPMYVSNSRCASLAC